MSQLLIEIDSPEDEAILLSLLPKLNGRVLEKKGSTRRSLKDALDDLAKTDIAEKYGDPSEWQREIREDRPLPGREK
ncbi:hypothetical protein [Larkinella rosea]|uniref:Uncharacterized protein n=1 Tax=Larkinella rosea TaxID=2025312 RepID=A0A3P1C2C2_9BACT|nr:hypothetical protein [Larkinella rosea]RRB07418.1 hypothetical protein EHT25_06460 [Larkinella rosea]